MRNLLILLSVTGLLVAAGFASTCVKGKGDVVRRPLELPAFQSIALQGALDVQLTRSATQRIEVEGQTNLIDLLVTEVKDGAWTIRTSRCYSTDKPFIVHLAIPTLERITLQGSGDITSPDVFETGAMDLLVQGSGDLLLGVQARTVKATVQGSGEIKLTGTCDQITAAVQGSGDIKAGGLKATKGEANVQGSGDITVNVTDDLVARINGSGDVKYEQKPITIDAQISGSGSVRPTK